MPKLHGLHGGERECVGINIPPAVVTNPTGSTLTLGNHTWGRYPEARKMLNGRVREDDPLTFADHVNEFSMKEVHMFLAGFVRAPVEGALNLATSPRRRGELDGRTAVLVEVQQTASRMEHIV
jgi:hypothetical protein